MKPTPIIGWALVLVNLAVSFGVFMAGISILVLDQNLRGALICAAASSIGVTFSAYVVKNL